MGKRFLLQKGFRSSWGLLWDVFRAFTNSVTEGKVQGHQLQVWAHGAELDQGGPVHSWHA